MIAREWHIPPWEVVGGEVAAWDRWKWLIRQRAVMAQEARKAKEQEAKAKHGRKG